MDLPHILTHQLASGVGENRESTTYRYVKTIMNFNIYNTIKLDLPITDHFSTFIQITTNIISKKITKNTINEADLYKSYNKNTFESLIKNLHWQNIGTRSYSY